MPTKVGALAIALIVLFGASEGHGAVGATPTGRWQHLMAYDAARAQIVLFGGDNEMGPLNDTWVWDGERWTQQQPRNIPPPMSRCGMVYDPARRRIMLIGDVAEGTWIWDGTDWTLTAPAIRQAHAGAVYDAARGQVVMFGGEVGAGLLKDTLVWDGDTWLERHPVVTPPPMARPSMVYDSGRGRSVLVGENDTGAWEWDGEVWTKLVSPGPSARSDHAMAYDAAHSCVLLFGGRTPGQEVLDETWLWDGAVWRQAASGPASRSGHAIAYHAGTRQVVLFGGRDAAGAYLDDTWIWDGAGWRRPGRTSAVRSPAAQPAQTNPEPADSRPGALKAGELKCEYRTNPLGVQTDAPRLSWVLESKERGQKQIAYRILVASTPAKLNADTGDLWDPGKVLGSDTFQISYAGKPLHSRMRAFWKVRVWDKEGRASAWSSSAEWSMGLLAAADWTAKWIGTGRSGAPLPILRREFNVAKRIQRATAYISGLGFFELRLNGEKVGDHVLEPGWTNYHKTCLYTTFDITANVRTGRNAVGVLLGNGMYNITGGRYVKFRASFGPPKTIVQIELAYTDGTFQRIVSDASWQTTAGPITFSCIFGGEDFDARREPAGWDQPDFDASAWKAAAVMEAPTGRLTAESAPPIKVHQVFDPAKISEPKPGVYVYDLGQNFSGWPVIVVSGPAGAEVKMVPGELLDQQGLVTQRSSGGPAYFKYTLRGGGKEVWHPRFSYYGFRYVQVEGAVREASRAGTAPVLHKVEGQFLHASAEVVGSFSCSNTVFNRIHDLIRFSILSNMQSVFTDCPHREKLGWLEAEQLMSPSVMSNYDTASFYEKAVHDMSDSQLPDGLVPNTAPEYPVWRSFERDSAEWGSAFLTIPWHLYQRYGDVRVLSDHYSAMRRYARYLTARSSGHIIACEPGDRTAAALADKHTSLTITAMYYWDLRILERVAERLGFPQHAAEYAELARNVRRAFNERFINADTGVYRPGNQTALALPLVLGIAEPEREPVLLKSLVEDIRAHGNHTTATQVGLRFVFTALGDGGRSDVIYDMLSRTDPPSYGYQLAQSATALTEAWDADPRESQNHAMLGNIEEWFYQVLAGLGADPGAVAFDHIVIRPRPVGNVTSSKATYKSIRGPITSEWEIVGADMRLKVAVPPNAVATVYIPATREASVTEGGRPAAHAEAVRFLRMEGGAAVFEVGSGRYDFVSWAAGRSATTLR